MEIAQYDLEGNFLQVFQVETIAELAHNLGLSSSGGLRKAVESTVLSCHGFQYRHVKDSLKVPQQIGEVWHLVHNASRLKRIVGKYFNDRLICTYRHQQEAADKNHISTEAVSKCLNNRQLTSKGFSFRYLN